MSLNVFKCSPDQIVGQNGNREFTDLVTVLGCNIGSKFDINKLNYDKIIIATDADVDGKFIRSLLLAFFFRMMPEVIADGRLFIAEPPLYRVDDKKNPFVINKQDYNDRYMQQCTKDYRIGYKSNLKQVDIDYMSKNQLLDFLDETKNYAKDMVTYAEHFRVNDRLLEMVLEELAGNGYDRHKNISSQIRQLNIPKLLDKIQATFPEIYYDESDGCFHGVINFTRQLFEISEGLVRKCEDEIELLQKWQPPMNGALVLKSTKTGTESDLSLLEALKVIRKYQPNILHRFKGLGENSEDDLKITTMDPNTRTLIRVQLGDIENDMAVFQMLRGDSKQNLLDRKQFLRSVIIRKDDIDT